MITKAYIIRKSENNINKFYIRIPIFETPGLNINQKLNNNIIEATLCYTPGSLDSYKEGDCVFITFENSGEILVEKDGEETIFEKDAKGNQTPWIAQEKYPKVSGVLVIAQGGDSPVVVQNIQEAVQALFQLEAHKIKVMKMK